MKSLLILSAIFLLLAGAIDGTVEGWEFDGRTAFEQKFNASPEGFWGSMSWKRKYTNPNIWNKYLGVFDFYHVADDLRKLFYLLGGFILGVALSSKINGLRIKYSLTTFTIAFILSGAAKSIAMMWIRI